MATPRETYDRLVASFITQLEAGVAPWVRPWSAGPDQAALAELPRNATSGRRYNGVNVLLLWAAQQAHGYRSARWLTYKQAKDAGGHVRAGEHGQLIVFFRHLTKTKTDPNTGESETEAFRLLRGYVVFNLDQCEGLPERLMPAPAEPGALDQVDQFITNTGAVIRRGGNRAFYAPAPDFIQLPPREAFKTVEHDHATALHELGHWSGAKHRLDREFGRKFGDRAYAVEELTAELAAAFLCAELGVTGQLQHVEYLASWIEALKAQPNILWTASSKASEATEFVLTKGGHIAPDTEATKEAEAADELPMAA